MNLQCFERTVAPLSLTYWHFSLYCEQGTEGTWGLGAEVLGNSNEFHLGLFCRVFSR